MTPYWELGFFEAYKQHIVGSKIFGVLPSNPVTFFFRWLNKKGKGDKK